MSNALGCYSSTCLFERINRLVTIHLNSANRYWGISEGNLYKIAVIFLYIVMIFWLQILLNTQPAQGYEISIYDAYSPFFWFLLICSIIYGISLSIYFIVGRTNLWKYSLLTTLVADTVILFLPIIRNYEFYAWGGWDIFAHLAWSKFITNTGYLMGGDLYPATHILVTTLDQLGLLNPGILAVIVSVAFFILYIFSLFILGRAVLKDNNAGALLFIFGSPLLFSFGHYALIPFSFALFLFPLALYIMHGTGMPDKKREYYICFIILSLFIIFCHPMVTLILLLVLGVLYGCTHISNKYRLGFSCRFNILNMTTIIGVIFIFWYINFQNILNMGERVLSALLGVSDTETILTYNLGMVDQSGASLLRVVEGVIKVYGPMAIYFVVALLIALYLVKKFLTKREHIDEIIYVILFVLSIGFGAALTLGYFIVFELIRATSFAIIMATIVCGIGLYILIMDADTPKKKQIFAVIIIAVLCSVSILSALNVYSSPWRLSPGVHTTEMEKSGVDWILMHRDVSIPIYSDIGLINNKYVLYFQELHKSDVQQSRVILNGIPIHFGYDQNRSLSQSIDGSGKSNLYMVTNEFMRQKAFAYPEEMQLTREQFSQEDFFRLNCDTAVSKLYMNQEWELWIAQFK